jgi:CHAD domain-containing protein
MGREPEALHDHRVAVRRLRAANRTFAAGNPPRLQATLAGELRWLGQELGAVRDLDVQRANLAWHMGHVERAARSHLAGFRRHMEHERAERRAALDATLDSRRYFRLLAALERFAASPPPRRPRGDAAASIAQAGRRAVKRALRRLIKRGDAIGEVPEAEDLHALRIRAKRLRYILEALKPIAGSQGRKLIKLLVRLQDVLGRFNDAIVAAAFIRDSRDGAEAAAGAAVRGTLTSLADAELRRAGAAQSDFARAWRRFSGKSVPSLRHTLLRQLKAAARRPAVGAGTASGAVQEVPTS